MIPVSTLLLDDPDVLTQRLPEVAEVVASTLGRPYPDVLQRIRYGRGILARRLNEAQARLLRRALAKAGFGVFSVQDDEAVESPRRAKRVSRVQIDAEGLSLSLRGLEQIPPVRLDWREVWAVAPHGLLLESGSEERSALPRRGETMANLTHQALALISDLRRYRERERTPVRLALDVLAEGSNLYRIHHDDVGVYRDLDTRGEHSAENFLFLCEALLDQAPASVLIPPAAQRFLRTGSVEPILFAKREALDNYLYWITQAHAQGVGFEESPDDLDDDELTGEDEAIVVDGSDADADDLDEGDALADDEDDADDADDADDEDDADDADDADDTDGADDADLDDVDLDEDLDEVDIDEALDEVDTDEGSGETFEDEDDSVPVFVGSAIGSSDLEEQAPPPPRGAGLPEDEFRELAFSNYEEEDDDELSAEDLSFRDDELTIDDGEVSDALEHFEQTSRLDQASIEAMLLQSRDLDDDLDDTDEVEVDGEVSAALDFFDAPSGRIDVRQFLGEDETTSGE